MVALIAGDQGDLRGKLLCRCCPRQSWNCWTAQGEERKKYPLPRKDRDQVVIRWLTTREREREYRKILTQNDHFRCCCDNNNNGGG